jgi:hypothetical protein
VIFAFVFSSVAFGQDETDNARKSRWTKFSKQNWQKFDFKKKKLTKVQLSKLDKDDLKDYGVVSELELLRGIVFGKNGRIFKEHPIQDYLAKQIWYKPKESFSNDALTKIERDNLDLIRLAEAENHATIQPGDMRIWQNKLITEDNLSSYSSAELRVLIAEIEAIHGKTFADEQWLQKYFEDRYWYKANANYSSTVLNETERKNIEFLLDEKNKGRNTAIAIGDMDKFENVALTDDLLNGLTMMELRVIRNEIWARHGRKFESPGIRQYFEWRDWYKPLKDQSKVKISDIEQQNINLILAREAKIRENLSTEELTEDSLSGLFIEDLRILRNEIFARHGRIFKDAELQKYFISQAWYQPNPEFKDDQLNETEFKNLSAIKSAEESAISKFSEVEG